MALLQIARLDWRKIVQEYMKRITDEFGHRLIAFIASYDPDVAVDDYNVVIVLDKVQDDDWRIARAIARELEKEMGMGIMIIPAVVEKGSILAKEAQIVFLLQPNLKQWTQLIREYKKRISKCFGRKLVAFFASQNPDVTVDDYNVVIVLDRVRDDDWRIARAIARELEREMGTEIMIVPAVVEKGSILEKEAKNVFGEGQTTD